MRAGMMRLGQRASRMSLRQRSVVFAVVAAAAAAGAVVTADNALAHRSSLVVMACAGVSVAVATADYVFRERQQIQSLPTDRAALARQSRDAFRRSRSWIWWLGGSVAIWNAVGMPPATEPIVNLCLLSFCAAGFALAAAGFWRAGGRPGGPQT